MAKKQEEVMITTVKIKYATHCSMADPIDGDITHHYIIASAVSIPKGIPTDANPRFQDIMKPFYQKVSKILTTVKEFVAFHLKCRGITILTESIENDKYRKELTLNIKKGQGIVDGGHLYKIILDAKKQLENLEVRYVPIYIKENIPMKSITEMASGLNSGTNVKISSIRNKEGKYDEIKGAFPGYVISAAENEPGDVTIQRVLDMFAMMNIGLYPDEIPKPSEDCSLEEQEKYEADVEGNHPAQHGDERYWDYYNNNRECSEKLFPIAIDIMTLANHLDYYGPDLYNEKGGRALAIDGMFLKNKTGKFPFIKKEGNFELACRPRRVMMFGLRYLIKEGNDGNYTWKVPFSEVLAFIDCYGGALIRKVYTDCRMSKDVFNSEFVGKEGKDWNKLHQFVKKAFQDWTKKGKKA